MEALERLEWHREQGHRLVLVTATVMPMAQAMADYLAMDAVYGCGPENMTGIMSGSERGWSVAPDGENWRRVVALPEPQRIFEMRPIHWLLKHG